jgi:hypothetical protein
MTNMLNESEELLARLKHQTRFKEIQRAKRKWYWERTKWWIRLTLSVISTVLVVFFPMETGEVIGRWVHEFFGTIIRKAQGL